MKKDWSLLLVLVLFLVLKMMKRKMRPPGSLPVSFSHSLLLASLGVLGRSLLEVELELKLELGSELVMMKMFESFLRLLELLMTLVEELDHG